MLTRSRAKKAQEQARVGHTVLVAAANPNTGPGKERRARRNVRPYAPSPLRKLVRRGDTSSSSLSSIDSANSLFDGSLTSLSSASSASTSSLQPSKVVVSTAPKTPPPSAPRPLSRSPPHRWTFDGDTHRFVVVPDDLSEESMNRRRHDAEGLQDHIFERAYSQLMRHKYYREKLFEDRDQETTSAGSDTDRSNEMADIMMDDEEIQAGPSNSKSSTSLTSRPRALGPCGTEIIFTMSEDAQPEKTNGTGGNSATYPESWIAEPSNSLRARLTEEW